MEHGTVCANDSSGLFGIRPILSVESVAKSIRYYVESLGFRLGWAWSNAEQRFLQPFEELEVGFALVARGPIQFMLSQKSQGAPGMWLHLDVHTADQLDALHAEWTRNGARTIEPPVVRPWGTYEMRVEDLDGHVLRVSAPPRAETQDVS